MTSARTSYAHMLAKPNAKHVRSLVNFFEQGAKPESRDGFGVEIEHLPVHNSDDTAVTYGEANGIETLMLRLREYYDESREYWQDDQLVGLARDGIGISLEPGGQIETSIGVVRNSSELGAIYEQFRREIDPILDELGFRLVNYGYQPKSCALDIPINPKRRYAAMNEYLGHIGQYGPCMMRASASTQVSIDYANEQDAIEKLRLGSAVGPIINYFFRNTPFFEGEVNHMPLRRQRMWDFLDCQRTNLIPGLYEDGFGWEDYAVGVLGTPLMFADLTHTPEAAGLPVERKEFAAFRETADDVYPDRELNDYEVAHILSTHFNDVRLKNFIEMRHWDSLPIERAQRLMEIVGALFYDPARLAQLADYFDGIGEADVFAAKATLNAHGDAAEPCGNSLEFWREFLGLEGVMADVPGDAKWPEVFQA